MGQMLHRVQRRVRVNAIPAIVCTSLLLSRSVVMAAAPTTSIITTMPASQPVDDALARMGITREQEEVAERQLAIRLKQVDERVKQEWRDSATWKDWFSDIPRGIIEGVVNV